MYEDMTYEHIMEQMLERVPDTFDKREGSVIYDALAPAAAELAMLYIELDVVLNQTFADTATHDFLEKRCAERGIVRKQATRAIVQGEFTPTTIDVLGKRFSCGLYNYIATEKISDGAYQMECETNGILPNSVIGALIPIEYISGLETASITTLLIPGEDIEDDESLRQRYYESISSQAFGGNVQDYKEKTGMISGVGGVKVTPVWDGGGTVKLTIIASDYSVPTKTLIDDVQKNITAIAPIGHVVTVDAVRKNTIDISAEITYQSGWSWESSEEYITSAIDDYFLSLTKLWEDSEFLIVRISGIEQKILSCPGVLDIQNTTLNGSMKNMHLDAYEIPVRGDVSDA